MPEPGALPLRVLSGRHDDARLGVALDERPFLELTNRAVATRVPGGCAIRHVAHECADLVAPSSREHIARPRLDAARELVTGVDDEIPRRPARWTAALTMEIAHAPTGEQDDLRRAEQLRAAQMRARCIQRLHPAAQAVGRESFQLRGECS